MELFQVETPVGYTKEEVEKAKAAIGDLPSELEKFYLYCGKSPELQHLQDDLMLPGKYPALLDPDYIVIFNENQGVCQAAVKKSEISLDDPPVYTSIDDGEWTLSSPHVSEFLKAMFDYQASIVLDFNPEDFFFVTEEEKAKIESLFPKLGSFNGWLYTWKVTVYGENGIRIALMENEDGGDIQMNYAANNQEDFDKVTAMLDGIGEPM
ncbi:MAG: hypothetical protein J1F04_10520 [Oscillospiraceae bacterium]|nr:hypothetical protein [Oscillospiraceae bacterium]